MISSTAYATFIKTLKDGRWPFSIPVGYKETGMELRIVKQKDNHRTRNRKIVIRLIGIDPDKSPIIEDIFNSYISGEYSLESLARYINKKWNVKFTDGHLHRILNSKFYIGLMEYENNIYPHTYGNIISLEVFDKVKYVIEERSSLKGKIKKIGRIAFTFGSLMRCEMCECLIAAESSKNYIYYHCNQSKGKHKAPYFREEIIADLFEIYFDKIKVREEFIDSLNADIKRKFIQFINNYRKWYSLSNPVQKREILKLLFSDITLGHSLSLRINPPFDNNDENENSISFSEMERIIDFHNPVSSLFNRSESITFEPSIDTSVDTSITQLIINNCEQPISTDELVSLLNIDILELQNHLIDLQLEGKIDQDITGKWKIT